MCWRLKGVPRMMTWPCCSSGGLSPASHRGPGSSQVRLCGICGAQSGTGTGVLRVLWFHLPIIPPTAPHSSSSGAGTVSQTVAAVPSGLSLTPPQSLISHSQRCYLRQIEHRQTYLGLERGSNHDPCVATCFLYASCLAYSSTLTNATSETSDDFQQTI
jgi:hypothetical protein